MDSVEADGGVPVVVSDETDPRITSVLSWIVRSISAQPKTKDQSIFHEFRRTESNHVPFLLTPGTSASTTNESFCSFTSSAGTRIDGSLAAGLATEAKNGSLASNEGRRAKKGSSASVRKTGDTLNRDMMERFV